MACDGGQEDAGNLGKQLDRDITPTFEVHRVEGSKNL